MSHHYSTIFYRKNQIPNKKYREPRWGSHVSFLELQIVPPGKHAAAVILPVQPDNPGQPDNPQPQPDPNMCHWCGQVHEGFFQSIVGWFHSIFARLFGAKY